jgi:hypothetical protein
MAYLERVARVARAPVPCVVLGAIGITLMSSALFSAAPPRLQVALEGGAAQDAFAMTVWEQAIAAKGGRERLQSVRNLVVRSREDFSRSTRPDVATHEDIERLYVVAGKLWEFVDHRPGMMGANGLILDSARQQAWGSNGYPAKSAYPELVYRLTEGQCLYLMETVAVRPKPVSVRSDRLRSSDVDIVETQVGGDRVDFYLDHGTHLPVRIVTFRNLRAGSAPSKRIFRLSDYQATEGIQMPAKVRLGDDETDVTSTTYRFNVDYDESIFNPQSLRFEANGWMKR